MCKNSSASNDGLAHPHSPAGRVVNFRRYGSAAALDEAFGGRWIYVGRANPYAGLPQSPLANPYKVSDHGGRRGATLPLYRRWLWGRIQAGDAAVIAALRAIDEHSVMVCWCAPGPCHAELVLAAAAWLRGQNIP